jgi:hypothetical protein
VIVEKGKMANDPNNVADRPWRRLAGNELMYDTMGVSQISLLALFFGLREHHKLLEIGSGPMRAGRFFVLYLNKGNYCGVEPNMRATEQGLKHEIGDELCSAKSPRIVSNSDYRFEQFGHKFDFAVSYSLLTHVPPSHIPMIFRSIAQCFHRDSIFIGTAAIAKRERIADHEKWTNLPVNFYSFERIAAAAEETGMRIQQIGTIFQTWFCAYFDDNHRAISGIEEARKVCWNRVIPPWEHPNHWPEWIKGNPAVPEQDG